MSFAYEINDKVFAEYGGHLYEAKCVKRRMKDGIPQYYLKYFGFGKRNNRWQPEKDLYPYNEENREVMLDRREAARRLEEEQKQAKARKRASTSSASPSGGAQRSSLSVPPSLSRNLVLQHLRHADRMLIPLPRRPSVHEILSRFRHHDIDAKDDTRRQQEEEFCANMEVVFSTALGQRLLWSIERAQYMHWLKKRDALPVDDQVTFFARIYGAEHFLRLIVLMPELLRVCVPANMPIFQREHAVFLRELIEFMNGHQDELFTPTYQPSPPEYLRLSHFAGL
ncbi:hypothetical protein PTSG_07363 [Salpingoeca rosetta]|uniref:Uncharacterized protein n=1 Tax=Salpingoeca rosetta (strain ATCC 50818 / BSB-021) TaxID=946362 RepID=F2UJ73_SALR5|nr:uncharacterized protein PTSG_07363 [Salpingoeca rosetta]EGD77021.1 hypothetical protein PTSG_07363 [Salpingoeca rosetta]|eukprot:XP_004990861.1 hypothetical protein PTSG_07363 [Salpingoeca rosetta]